MNNKDRIDGFQRLIRESLTTLIIDDYVLLDIPNHCNIGDNLIWEGELQYLKKNVPYKCLYSANVFNWEEERIKSAPIILFHGGGNFGDLYRVCQDYRLYIIQKYHDKRIVIFPQTVWYNDASLLSKDSEIINEHPNIYICTRDQLSYDVLKGYIDERKLLLLPDMAFYINNIPQSNVHTGKKLFMLRTDREIEKLKIELDDNYDVKDWPTYYNNRKIQFIKNLWSDRIIEVSQFLQRIPLLKKLVDPVYGLYNRDNRARYINMGIDFFDQYDEITTTRLHGLILGVLMGKNVVIYDNKYNKCSNFYDTWLKDFDLIRCKYD